MQEQNVFFWLWTSPPSVYWGRHWCHSHDKMNHAFPLCFCILQVIQNWTVGRPGNKSTLIKCQISHIHHSGGFRGCVAASNVFLRTYLHKSIKWLYSSGMQQQQPGTVSHSCISSLLISRRLTRPRVAWRYSVQTFTCWKWVWQPPNFWMHFTHQWLNPPF